jgi:hypothetical protein
MAPLVIRLSREPIPVGQAGPFLSISLGILWRPVEKNATTQMALSQVGVAIGLSLVVATEFGQLGGNGAGAELAVTVINVLLGTTIVTEIVGPVLTRYALRRAGEIDRAEDPGEKDA